MAFLLEVAKSSSRVALRSRRFGGGSRFLQGASPRERHEDDTPRSKTLGVFSSNI
jgi:hypothetical protein